MQLYRRRGRGRYHSAGGWRMEEAREDIGYRMVDSS